MRFEQLENEIRKKFHTKFGKNSVIYDNTGSDATEDTWMRATIKFGENSQVSLGANKRFRVSGVFFVQIFVLVGTGSQVSTALADQVLAEFRSQTVNGVTYRTPSITHPGSRDGYWQTNVECPFYSDDVEA